MPTSTFYTKVTCVYESSKDQELAEYVVHDVISGREQLPPSE